MAQINMEKYFHMFVGFGLIEEYLNPNIGAESRKINNIFCSSLEFMNKYNSDTNVIINIDRLKNIIFDFPKILKPVGAQAMRP